MMVGPMCARQMTPKRCVNFFATPLALRSASLLQVAEVVARLERGGIANAVVNEVAAVAAHPQLAARGRWTTVPTYVGDIPALLPPHNLASVAPVMGRVPALGEHTGDALGVRAATLR